MYRHHTCKQSYLIIILEALKAHLNSFTSGSGKLTVLDINAKGRIGNGPALNAHSDSITALEFSPFNHCKLATASADNTVSIKSLY